MQAIAAVLCGQMLAFAPAYAQDKGMKGDERKKFMSDCPKG